MNHQDQSLTLEASPSDYLDTLPLGWARRLAIRSALRVGNEQAALRFAMTSDIRDENQLTNLLFYARYPSYQGRSLQRGDPHVQRWLEIRNRVVRPVTVSQTSGTQPDDQTSPRGALGILILNTPQMSFRYAFTPEDLVWTARFLVGEAGGRNDTGNRAVIWAMFNRFAFFTHRVSAYRGAFHAFLRGYSTPLQAVLNSKGAAARHMNKPGFIRTGGMYPLDTYPRGVQVPRGQLEQFLQLQNTPWAQLPIAARTLALEALTGRIPNPGIGNASEFADTCVYFRQNYGRSPNITEWQNFNRTYAMRRSRPLTWIGDIPNLTQYKKNTFFIDHRVRHLAPNAVRVLTAQRTSP